MCGYFNTTWHVHSTVQCFINKQYRDSSKYPIPHGTWSRINYTIFVLPCNVSEGKRVKWLIQLFAEKRTRNMPRLSKEERKRVMGMLECCISATRVAPRFRCSRETVYNLQERHQATGTTADRPRSGRTRVTSARQDRTIDREHVRNPFRTATQTARETPGHNNQRISRFTIC